MKRSRRNESASSAERLRDHECAYFRPAAEPYSAHIADPARDMNLPRSPGLQAGDISFVGDRGVTRPVMRHNHLSSVSVSTEHQVPGKRTELLLAVGIVRQENYWIFALRFGERSAAV